MTSISTLTAGYSTVCILYPCKPYLIGTGAQSFPLAELRHSSSTLNAASIQSGPNQPSTVIVSASLSCSQLPLSFQMIVSASTEFGTFVFITSVEKGPSSFL